MDVAPPSTNTYNSQNTHEFVIQGSKQTTYVFMGDAWDLHGTAASNYMWSPLAVNSGLVLTLSICVISTCVYVLEFADI